MHKIIIIYKEKTMDGLQRTELLVHSDSVVKFLKCLYEKCFYLNDDLSAGFWTDLNNVYQIFISKVQDNQTEKKVSVDFLPNEEETNDKKIDESNLSESA